MYFIYLYEILLVLLSSIFFSNSNVVFAVKLIFLVFLLNCDFIGLVLEILEPKQFQNLNEKKNYNFFQDYMRSQIFSHQS